MHSPLQVGLHDKTMAPACSASYVQHADGIEGLLGSIDSSHLHVAELATAHKRCSEVVPAHAL